MSNTHTPVHQRPLGGSRDSDQGAGGEERLVRRLRWGLIAIAVVAVGVLVFRGPAVPDHFSTERFDALQAPAAETTFSGRGKWTGYAR